MSAIECSGQCWSPPTFRLRRSAQPHELAEEVAEVAKPTHVGLAPDGWGFDHGTWSVLVHAFPKADIPMVQLSINARKRFEDHFDLGARLASSPRSI